MDSGKKYYEQAWNFRANVFNALLAEETSLSRVLSRFQDYENDRTLIPGDDGIIYLKRPEQDPITLLETPQRAISCGKPIPAFSYSKVDIGKLITSLAHGCDTLMELGSGYGLRLFEAWLAGAPRNARYVGIEPTASGRDLSRRLALLEPTLNFIAAEGDHIDFDPNLAGQRTLFISCFSLMYANPLGSEFFSRIAQAPGEVIYLFIEPIGFQLGANDERARKQESEAMRKGLNRDFFMAFNNAVSQGLLEPAYIGRDLFGMEADPLTQASVIIATKP